MSDSDKCDGEIQSREGERKWRGVTLSDLYFRTLTSRCREWRRDVSVK